MRYKRHIDAAIAEALNALEKANPQNLDLDRLRKLKSDVIISGSHNDERHLKPYTDSSKHKTSIKSFKLPFDAEDEGVSGDIGIMIVNNMLLTGFDAPVERVMYLDKNHRCAWPPPSHRPCEPSERHRKGQGLCR